MLVLDVTLWINLWGNIQQVYYGYNIYKLQHLKSRSFFCPIDIERCVKGSRRKWVDKFSVDQKRPPILHVWPVKLGTNLTRPEILKLENVGFQLPQKERITPTRLFNTSAPPLDLVSPNLSPLVFLTLKK